MAWKVYIENQPAWHSAKIHMANVRDDGKVDIVQPLVLDTIEQGLLASDNGGLLGEGKTYAECQEFLRAIMDATWEIGIRPSKFADHTNELKAVRYHLEDMRLLAKVRSRS
ncbi:hypothetical protein LCGC14_2759590 [marine sediment metagenome]|uniref:Uncharacterized protein n=1 Tax=marine sediment metagenome TaxID=412755 RepID=A0A0F8YZC5_9ZZZZ